MAEGGEGAGLPLEAGGVGVRREELQGDAAAELRVRRRPDLGHAAAPEQLAEPIPAREEAVRHGDTVCAERGGATDRRGSAAARAGAGPSAAGAEGAAGAGRRPR